LHAVPHAFLKVPDAAIPLRQRVTRGAPSTMEHVPAVKPPLGITGEDQVERAAVKR